MSNNDVIIYTDGSSRGNPGPGGYGIVMEDCKTG
ncbi:ribonuclease HI, partial [Flavobacteriaceae bacterium]|nr:ribonuclease HI [Flavobacteriaceae bacterium]